MTPRSPGHIPTRSTLVSRLKDWQDADSWREFFQTYSRLIHNTALKEGLTEAEAQDVVQDTVLSVAKKMPEFKYDRRAGSFKGWLLQLTRWRILNQRRKRLSYESLDAQTGAVPELDSIPDPTGQELLDYWESEWKKNLLEVAIERVKESASPHQYEIFYLHVAKKLPAREVAATLNVSVPQVYLAKHRVSVLVKKEVRRLEKEMV